MSFGISWTIVIPSQSGTHFDPKTFDEGIIDKLVEYRPPNEFVAADEFDPTNHRHIVADVELAAQIDQGALSGELVFFARCFYPSLDASICKGRNMNPLPPNCKSYQAELQKQVASEKLKGWADQNLEYCAEQDAVPCPQLHTVMAAAGFVDASSRTAAGIGPTRYQCRRGEKKSWFNYYKVSLKSGDTRQPVKLK